MTPNVALDVGCLCDFEIDCMRKLYSEQETDGINEGLFAELIAACE